VTGKGERGLTLTRLPGLSGGIYRMMRLGGGAGWILCRWASLETVLSINRASKRIGSVMGE
jgi:hypothetical protein